MDILAIPALAAAYRSGSLTVPDVLEEVLSRIDAAGDDRVWISRFAESDLRARAALLQQRLEAPDRGMNQPLLGIPFAVKDSIDVAGLPTTAGCPAFAYEPHVSASIVARLLDAGAICVGKTNLDQFASGLVGVRSPYGVSRNPYDPDYIPGGSSSGSAVAVSAGLVSFSLGTDAAGSGRVPAAFNNIVGLKPTRGLVSTGGFVPACRMVDCPSVFALSCPEAWQVLDVIAGFDDADPYSRLDARAAPRVNWEGEFRFGVPPHVERLYHSEEDAVTYEEALASLEDLGGVRVEIDWWPFREAAALLYEGAFVADRIWPLQDFIDRHGDEVHPVTYEVLTRGLRFQAPQAFAALDRLELLKRQAARVLRTVDALVVPTAPTIYTIAEVLAQPFELNHRLGYYTNFVNLLDLAAIAVPCEFRYDGLPTGITFIGPAFDDATLTRLGTRFECVRKQTTGATDGEGRLWPAGWR